jgi:hypothetical protein
LENRKSFLSQFIQWIQFCQSTIRSLDYNSIEKRMNILNELMIFRKRYKLLQSFFCRKGGVVLSLFLQIRYISKLRTSFSGWTIHFKPFEMWRNWSLKSISIIHYLKLFWKQITNFQYPKTNGSFTLSNTNQAYVMTIKDTFLLLLPNAFLPSMFSTLNKYCRKFKFQQSPLIVPTFYKMAMNNQPKV